MANIDIRLKELRKLNKMTQRQVSDAVGITESNYQLFEYGKYKPSFDSLVKLADLFDVSMDYLAGRTDKPKINL